MPELVKITQDAPNAIPIYGFHGACSVRDVASALEQIGHSLEGKNHTIHIMSGTHGYCAGQVGAVATREQKFANEDRSLSHPKTRDNHTVDVQVHDFNNNKLPAPDPVTGAMSKLNTDMRKIVEKSVGNCTFVLAYCCSAGTR